MKKTLLFLSAALLVSVISISNITFAERYITVKVDGKSIEFPDAKPFLDTNNRTQVPVRFVSQALGATVEWNAEAKKVTIKKGSDTVELKVGESKATKNGTVKVLDTASLIKDSRTYVPLRFVSELLGAQVSWQADTKTVLISTSTATPTAAPTKVISGYVVPVKPASKIVIEGDDVSVRGKNYPEILISMSFYKGDMTKMLADAKAILLQKIDKSVVEEVINYASGRKNEKDDMGSKYFYTSDKKILVETGYNYPTNIYVYLK